MTTHDLTRTPPALLRRARLTFVILAVAVPVLLTVIGVGVILSWLPELPEIVVTHWGVAGADRTGPASMYLWLLIGTGLGLPWLMAVTTLAAVGTHWGGAARLMGSLAVGLSALSLVMNVGSLGIQRGIGDPADVPGVGGIVALAFAALLFIGAIGWLVQPRVEADPGRTLEARHAVRVADGERVVWLGSTTMPRAALAAVVLLLLALVVLAAYMLLTGVEGGGIVAIVVIVVAAALATAASFRVRITPEGFSARSLAGWPRVFIPTSEIVSARAVDVSPFGEFGGWGWRVAVDGRTGIIMRRGAAVEVSRRERKPFIVTIDGAEEAAALLQAYVERGRTDGGERSQS
ncbi:DUF1648 domain-containing protein [Microbacterium hydrocarbonoxydans]|uniref:DUF1648 domain-containing protein n=1 Tax=Microbacterium hydrocarbonoxydans TaxID=273678 RepID=UPI0013DB6A3F|nr:DUF1648 domain-containing protein [Microbacterium hydrocarbonoxydans]